MFVAAVAAVVAAAAACLKTRRFSVGDQVGVCLLSEREDVWLVAHGGTQETVKL